MGQYQLSINGETRQIDIADDTPLLYVLRSELGLNSPRFGCGLEQCGACRVELNGELVYSCNTTIAAAHQGAVTTVEGISRGDELHPLQKAILEVNAGQCGYCLSGMVMAARELLRVVSRPTREQIQQALNPHLCRCGSHNRIIRAIQSTVDN